METLLWDTDYRLIPALFIAALGAWLTVLGAISQVRALRLPTSTPGKNHGWLRAMRQMIQGM